MQGLLEENLVPLVSDVHGSVHGVAADLVLHGVLLVSHVPLPPLLLCPGGEHHPSAAAAAHPWHGDAKLRVEGAGWAVTHGRISEINITFYETLDCLSFRRIIKMKVFHPTDCSICICPVT